MPLIDLVIDTNVLVHASNGQVPKQRHSINLIDYLLASSEVICIDDGFVWDDTNRSFIGSEYRNHLKNGMLGYTFVVTMLAGKRFKECSRSVPVNISKKINQCISHLKPRDKTFLKVTYNSISKTLISHDNEDFHQSKRSHIIRQFKIEVMDASDIVG